MALTRPTTAREIATTFAAAASHEPIARDLWVSTEPDGVHLWLLTEPLDDDHAARALYALLDVLDERFPESSFELHVLNPRCYTADPRESLPGWAERIPLRTA